jgi:CHAT domain-containing protein
MSNRQAKRAVAVVAALSSVALAAFVGLNRQSPQPLPDSNSFEYVHRLVWLNNWAEAAEALRVLEARGLVPGDSSSQRLCSAIKLRGHVESGHLQAAAAELRKLTESKEAQADARLKLLLMSALGDVLFQFDLQAAEAVWQVVYQTAAHADDSVWKSRSEGELGAIAFLKGDVTRAVRLVASTALRAETNGDVASQIKSCTALGEGLAHFGRRADALRFFDRALRLYREVPGAYFPFTAYVGKARLLAETGSVTDARSMLERALAESREKRFRAREARLLAALADVEARAGNLTQSRELLFKAADLAANAGMFRIESDVTTRLADLATTAGGGSESVALARRSVDAAERAGDLYAMPRKLAVLAEALSADGKVQAAESTYERATEMTEVLLRSLANPKDKNTLVGTMDRVFRGHFQLAVEQLEDPQKAFAIVESARARGLFELLMRSHHSAHAYGSPVSPALVELHLKLGAETDPRKRKALIDRVWETEARAYRPGTSDAVATKRPEPVTLPELQQALRNDEILLEYVLGNTRSYALEVSRQHVGAYQLPGRKDIEEAVDLYARQVTSLQDVGSIARDLYAKLLEPVPGVKTARRIVIVPDGKLHGLPFDGLVDSRGQLLLSRAVVSYAPSASVNVRLSRIPSREPAQQRKLLAVGGVRYASASLADKMGVLLRRASLFNPEQPDLLTDLPGSKREISQIEPLVKDGVDSLIGAKATESALKATDLSRYRALHFAVHASIDEQFPDRSALRLASDSARNEDGLLQTREVIGLVLNAELVTLSACDAGSGRVEGLAGLNSLVQAFLMAGARSVVASTWPAEDSATAELMRLFYSHLRSGADKAEALTLAKRDLIARYGSSAQPFLWAGFRLVGDPHGRF